MPEQIHNADRPATQEEVAQAFNQFAQIINDRIEKMRLDIEQQLKNELTSYIDTRFSELELRIERRMNDNTWRLAGLMIAVVGIAVAILKLT